MIEQVGPQNQNEVDAFLAKYEESTQFLINNMRAHGPALKDHHNSGNYKLIRTNGEVSAVFCLARRGNLLVQSENGNAETILKACGQEPFAIKGFIGDWNSVEPVYHLYKAKNPGYRPTYESKEILYSYPLTTSDAKLKHDARVRFLEPEDFPQFLQFSNAYLSELSLPEERSDELRRQDFESQVRDRMWWGLFDGAKLLSRTGLNSKGAKIGQVGGVFTPKEVRQRGLAKAVMFHMLKDCRDIHGHAKSILFTGETDTAARKLYESMGYQDIGSFALILS